LKWHKEVREYLNEHVPSQWVGRAAATDNLVHLATPVTRPDSVWFLPVAFHQGQCLHPITSKTLPELRQNIDTAIGNVTQDMLWEGFGGNGSIVWTSAVSRVGRTSNAFKVTMKLQTFLFQMVVTSCISVQYLWKCGFAKSSDNLYAPCIYIYIYIYIYNI